jgi:hypothetical protein
LLVCWNNDVVFLFAQWRLRSMRTDDRIAVDGSIAPSYASTNVSGCSHDAQPCNADAEPDTIAESNSSSSYSRTSQVYDRDHVADGVPPQNPTVTSTSIAATPSPIDLSIHHQSIA